MTTSSRIYAGIEPYIGIKQKLQYTSQTHLGIVKNLVNLISWKNNFTLFNADRWLKNRKIYFNILDNEDELDDKQREKLKQLGDLTIPIGYKVVKTLIDVALEELERRRYYYELLPYTAIDYPKVLFLNILLQNELKKQQYICILRQILEDSAIYGCGILHIIWGKFYKTGYNEIILEGDPILNIPTKKVIEKNVKFDYEGNVINVINPAMFDFDSSFSILDIDKWRYCIIRSLIGIDDLIDIVKKGEDFINVDVLEEMSKKEGFSDIILPLLDAGHPQLSSEEKSDLSLWWGKGRKVLVENIYMKIIPSKFGLSDSSDEEIWMFIVVNRRLIIKASPMTYNHNKFPVVVYTWNGSLNEKYPAALMDYIEPLQTYINWLLRKYKENVNACVNRMFILNEHNLENPQDFSFDRALAILKIDRSVSRLPGILDNTVRELNFDLKTASHLNIIPMFIELTRTISGISELYLGTFPRGRRTRGEIELQAILSSTGIRALLRNMHNWIGYRLTNIVTSNLRQFLQGNTMIELRKDEFDEVRRLSDIAKNLEYLETLTGRILINLDVSLIKGEYDFYLGDYLEPSYDSKTITALTDFMKVVGNIPLLGNMLALLFKWDKIGELLFRIAGSKNPEDFINMNILQNLPEIIANLQQTQNKQSE